MRINKNISFIVFSIFLMMMGTGFVNASLCKSYNGYYYDCDDVPFRCYKPEQGYMYYEGYLMEYGQYSGRSYRDKYYQGYYQGFNDGKKYCDDCSDSVVVILDFEERQIFFDGRDNDYNSNCYCRSSDYLGNCRDYRCS